MDRPSYELADMVRAYGEQFLKKFGHLLGAGHLRVLSALMNCRTAVLGGHVDACDHCEHRSISYTRAETGTVPSARALLVTSGLPIGQPSCCLFLTFMWCSRCRNCLLHWRCKTSVWSMAFCSVQ